jgi:hypothetical protein
MRSRRNVRPAVFVFEFFHPQAAPGYRAERIAGR